jgi:hypothetical protein
MAAGAPAPHAYGRVAIRAWDKQYRIDVPAFATGRLVADSRSLDDEGHGSGGVPAQPLIEQMRSGSYSEPFEIRTSRPSQAKAEARGKLR